MAEVRTVRIAVVGDESVGKTSLITAAATETFPDRPPPVLPPARLPADTTPEGVPVVITDTSSRPEDKQAMELACQEASVIVLCFAMDKAATLRRISSFWMPELRRLGITTPVVLVGCRSDARPADQSLHQAVLPIVKAHPQIETCMECSARKLQFVGEVFYYALKSVVHPMAPLFDPESQTLKPLAARALRRVFRLCDRDGDGVLSDAELNAFQVQCFNAPLQPEELVGVKAVVAEHVAEGITPRGLTLPGFLYLHALFIERGRLETTWAVLRRFGYGNDLRLTEEALGRPFFGHAPDQVAELTEAGRAFFAAAFERFDVDDDGALSPREREEMFSTAPADPWSGPEYAGILVETSRRGLLTLGGFLAMWALTTAADPLKTLEYAIYLGFQREGGGAERLVQVSRARRQERRAGDALPRRAVLQCYVVASEGADPGAVLEGLIAQARPTHGAPTAPVTTAAAAVATDAGAVTMIMRSFSDEQTQALLEGPGCAEELQRCDVAVFVFSGAAPASLPAALQRMVTLASAAGDALPCLLLVTDADRMGPALEAEVAEACCALALKQPVPLRAPASPTDSSPGSGPGGSGAAAAPYQEIIQTAFQPDMAIPETPTLKATRQHRRMLRRALLFTGAGTTAALAGYFAYRLYKSQQAAPAESGAAAGQQAAGQQAAGRQAAGRRLR